MKVRLGYACISETLNVTTSTPYTYTQFCKEKDDQKLDSIIQSNFSALKEILRYNQKNNIHFFRMSSNMIPLATKSDVFFDYLDNYKNWYQEIGSFIRENKMYYYNILYLSSSSFYTRPAFFLINIIITI